MDTSPLHKRGEQADDSDSPRAIGDRRSGEGNDVHTIERRAHVTSAQKPKYTSKDVNKRGLPREEVRSDSNVKIEDLLNTSSSHSSSTASTDGQTTIPTSTPA